MRNLLLFLTLFSCGNTFAQLGFCEGSKGDPIFHENFGTGTGTGAALPAGLTNYTYVDRDPNDGQYTISSRIGQDNGSWHNGFPQNTISNGKALIVNANDNTAGMFYETSISGLCEATTYEFSAFLMNVYDAGSVGVCEGTGIPINVRFEIWDETSTLLLKSGSTGDIHGTTNPKWEQYALVFRSQAGQSNVILRMFNNGIGGCGNDLAIDDIIFRSCGDLTTISSDEGTGDQLDYCESEAPVSVELTATPDHSVYNQHAYQWQESFDNLAWADIPGAITATYTSPALSASKYYRVKVAEDQVNLSNNRCSSASEAFYIHISEKPGPPQSNGDKTICANDPIPSLSVQVENDETVDWYDASAGGNLLVASSNIIIPGAAGTFYAEARKTGMNCEPGPRTAVKLTINEIPEVVDEEVLLCPGGDLQLSAGPANMNYNWSTGESTRQIMVNQPGTFSVEVSHPNGCSVTKQIHVSTVAEARIEKITSEGNTVIIYPASSEEFEYSLDGINFQPSHIFRNISGGIYTAYVRDLAACNTATQKFPHIVVPQFISPNDDGYNDSFRLRGVNFFELSEIFIFDRYGKLIKAGNGKEFLWDGTLNGVELPASDYWYEIRIPGFMLVKGHFSLLR